MINKAKIWRRYAICKKMTDYTSAIKYLRTLHPTVRHRVLDMIMEDYDCLVDVSLLFCNICYMTTSDIRGNCDFDFNFCTANVFCRSMICKKCQKKIYPKGRRGYICETHRNASLFQMLYNRFQIKSFI